jgi:heme exporter protein D
MPAGIGWQLLNADRLDFYSMLGWFVWPAVPTVYLLLMLLIGSLAGRGTARNGTARKRIPGKDDQGRPHR